MRKLILISGIWLLTCFCMFAQESESQREEVAPEQTFFVPHWYVQAQGGIAYDVGESNFSHLISPTLQLALGYNFNEWLGVRGSLSGLWARNRYAFPEASYKWNYFMPAVEGNLDLSTLFMGKNPVRDFRAYLFAGFGLGCGFNNDDAIEASKITNVYGIPCRPFEKLWTKTTVFPALRFGISADYQITDELAICGELNANMMSDRFNSKKGKNDNLDWHFNLLVGVKFNIGKTHGKVEPMYREIPLPPKMIEPKPEPVVEDVPIDKISFNVNVYFVINQSIIRSNQLDKLNALVKYLNEHPKAFVRLSGFADKDTGTPQINMRLSIERSQVVSQFLQDAGIAESRIRRFAKGDRVQPFDIPEDNRVCICFVYDPENPVPQAFEY